MHGDSGNRERDAGESPAPPRRRLLELAWVFLRLGTIGFGGPAAHVALMEEEVVRRRRWLSREEFVDLVGAASLMPGPNSTELAIHLGRVRAGWPGLLVAGACFIVPAAVMVGVIAHLYVRFGTLPQAAAILYGVNPVVIVVVVQALIGLSRTAVRNRFHAAMGLLGVLLVVLGVHELVVLLVVGLLTAAASAPRRGSHARAGVTMSIGLLGAGSAAAGVVPAVSLVSLFLFFLKVGSVLFGSGYVLLAFLRADLVERWQWLSERQLLDAIAVGQMTPGPVFTTATFVGYLLAGTSGAVFATVGIFLPAFVFVAASGPLLAWLRRSATTRAFLDGVNVASLALMAVVALQLGRAAVVDVTTAVIAIASGLLLLRGRVGSTWLILGGGLVGLAVGTGS